jgi:phospholipase D
MGYTINYMNLKKYYLGLSVALLGSFAYANLNTEFSDAKCSICFTPSQNCTKKIINKIDAARKEILVQSYSFTSPEIAEALIRAKKRGIKVVCLFDKSQKNNFLFPKLKEADIRVEIDNVPGIAHNKVMIIDEHTVLTGSFNFTKAAQFRNTENSVCIQSSVIALQYKQNFLDRMNKNQLMY